MDNIIKNMNAECTSVEVISFSIYNIYFLAPQIFSDSYTRYIMQFQVLQQILIIERGP